MADTRWDRTVRQLKQVVQSCTPSTLSDRELLERFAQGRDESAFAALVQRHGALVKGICWRILRQAQDVEDTFQATFMVLARQAAAVRWQESVGSWLHTVAYRLARQVQRAADRQRATAAPCVVEPGPDSCSAAAWQEMCALLDEEVQRLPARYRSAVLLCYLEGQTRDQAAQQLGWSLRTLDRRLEQGRELLRERLARRGVTLSSTLLLAGLAHNSTTVSAAQADAAVRAGSHFAAGQLAEAGGFSAQAALLANGALRTLSLARARLAAALLLTLGVLAGGAALLAQHARQAAAVEQAAELQPMGQDADLPPAGDELHRRLDLHGDPLPPGAIARLGTVRFRTGSGAELVRFAPDRKTLLSTCPGDCTIYLWDAATGKLIRRFCGHEHAVCSLTFAADGKTIASGSMDQTFRLWDVATGKEIRRIEVDTIAAFSPQVALAPDGKTLALGSVDVTIGLWDAATGKQIRRLEAGRDQLWRISSVQFAPDGTTLAAASNGTVSFGPDGEMLGDPSDTIFLWNPATGKLIRRLTGHQAGISSLAFAPDGKTLASGSHDHTIRLWQVATGKEVHRIDGLEGRVNSVAFAPDGKTLASALGEIRLWDAATGKEIRRFAAEEDCVVFSPDAATLASAGNALRLWEAATGKEIRRFSGHQHSVDWVACSPDGKTIASASQTTIALWDTATSKQIRQLTAPLDRFGLVTFSPDGTMLASADALTPEGVGKNLGIRDLRIRLWDVATGKPIREFPGDAAAFAPDGKTLASVCRDDEMIRLWDVRTGKAIRQFDGQQVDLVSISSDGKTLAAAGQGKAVHLWDVATGQERSQLAIRQAGEGKSPWVASLAFAPDGKMLAALVAVDHNSGVFDSFTIQLWDLPTGKEIRRINELGSSQCWLAFSPNGRMLASGGGDKALLWDAVTGQQLGRLEGHQGAIKWLAFGPSGNTLASASSDTSVLVWDMQGFNRGGPSGQLADEDVPKLWTALGGDDAGKSYDAVARLAASPKQALTFLQGKLQPSAPDPQLARLIADLDHPQFAVRRQAQEELEKLGPGAEAALSKVLAGKPSLEMRQRVEQLLDKITASPEQLRQLRAVQVLERTGTAEARRLLESLAKGSEWPQRLRDDAQAALARLAKQSHP